MAEVLEWRLQKPDCDRGAVIDGLDSRYASRCASPGEGERGGEDSPSGDGLGRKVAVTAKAALAAMPGARLLVLRFKDGNKGYVQWNVVQECLRFSTT